jgi:CRISPR-associated protein (TIGR02710 family)
MLKKALIVTVGTGTRVDVDIVRPLVKTVKDSRPDYTVFVATESSKVHAERIAAELSLAEAAWSVRILKQFDDVETVFLEVGRVIREVLDRGFSHEHIQVDFTSGTKAMSAGAVLAAVYRNCESLKYITGEREHGVVKDGKERFVTLCPQAVFAVRDIVTAVELVKRLRFQPATDILHSINANLLTKDEVRLVESVRAVAQAYDFWDRFEHIKFMGAIRKVDWRFHELQPFRMSEDLIKAVHRIGEVLRGPGSAVTEGVMVDLFNNAERRAMEGRYDDALARLYRLTEMLAQYVLLTRHGIDTGNADLNKIPPGLHETMEAHRDRVDYGKIKIGLRLSYELMAELGEEIGRRYMDDKQLSHLLNERNATILAHGQKPVSAGLYARLKERVMDLARVEIQDLDARVKTLNFPWLVS